MKKISDEIKKLIIKLAKEGKTKREITEKTNTSRTSIYNILKEEGIELEPPDESQDKEYAEYLTEAIVGDGWELTEIPQLIFNARRVTQMINTSLFELHEELVSSLDYYSSRVKKPVKLFNALIDFIYYQKSMKFSDTQVQFKNWEYLIEKGIFLSEIEEKIPLEEERLEELQHEISKLTENQNILIMKLLNKEREQKLNFTILQYQRHAEETLRINSDLAKENDAYRCIFKELSEDYPEIIKEYVNKNKKKSIGELENSEKIIRTVL